MSRLARIQAAATFEDLYALIPQPTGCDGSCHRSCGPIGFSAGEGARMVAAGRVVPNHARGDQLRADCPALTEDRRCAIYDARPALCRVWGASQPMPCTGGPCQVRLPLTDEETRAVLARSFDLGGNPR